MELLQVPPSLAFVPALVFQPGHVSGWERTLQGALTSRAGVRDWQEQAWAPDHPWGSARRNGHHWTILTAQLRLNQTQTKCWYLLIGSSLICSTSELPQSCQKQVITDSCPGVKNDGKGSLEEIFLVFPNHP